MQDIEKRLAQQYLSNESKLDKAISNLKNDFDNEIFAEKLTDIYLYQHQNNTIITNLVNKSQYGDRLELICNRSKELLAKLEESRSICKAREATMNDSLQKIKQELDNESQKKILELESQKINIDKDFKSQLKVLSTSYR